ncbi:MAG: biotin transporter BioY [Clostridia bacterium]|nr:biotin transporter BioY [Clostridia bacterium]
MKTEIRMMILAALFAALTAVGAFLQIPLGISSITLQFLFTALAGVLLEARWGALSQAVYVLIGLVGIPVFTQGGGLGYLFKPTCGFLFGLIPAAWIIGKLTERKAGFLRVLLASAAGLAVLYLVGIPYMYLILNVYLGKGMSLLAVLNAGMFLFLPGDALKLVVTAAASKPLLRSLRRK